MSERGLWIIGLALLFLLALLCTWMHRDMWQMPEVPAVAAPISPPVSAPKPPPAPAVASIALQAQWNGSALVLDGRVPDVSIKQAVVARAKTLYPGVSIDDRIQVAAGGTIARLASDSGAFFPPDLKRLVSGEATFDGALLNIKGVIEKDADRPGIEGTWPKADGLQLKSDLTVADGPKNAADLQARLNREMALANVEFETGSAKLTERGRGVLDRVALLLAALPAQAVRIEGHTDSRGAEAANQRLSEARAVSVKDYLAGKGIDEKRMTTAGLGAAKPVADNDTAEGRARNRRIEFKLP